MIYKSSKPALLGVLTAVCMVLSFLEHLVSLDFIAPGIKLGLANTVALFLIAKGEIKGGIAVNFSRIFLSFLLFGTPYSLCFSLFGGVLSIIVTVFFCRFKQLSLIGVGILGGAAHNIGQVIFACIFMQNSAAFYLLPVLVFAGAVCGAFTGFIANLLDKKVILQCSFDK